MHILQRSFVVALAAMALSAATPGWGGAQRPDTTRRADTTHRVRVDTTVASTADSLKPPITPRRAMLYSFLIPGYSQTVLGRRKAAAAFLFVEAMCISMIRESAADVHEARRTVNDTIVVSYSPNGTPIVAPPRFTPKEVQSRESHVEDWVALLIANHLFAGADAFVAANLWDVPARLGLRVLPNGMRGAAVTASIRW
jgi:hypothetical protein